MGIGPSSQLSSDDPSHPVNATASELKARNVSELWLRQYLSPKQLEALARLSLFAATFTAAGAAAVWHGAETCPAQLRDAELMLRCLRGLSVLQEVHHAAADPQQHRYSMHLLVRGLAADVQRQQPEDSQTSAMAGLVTHILKVVKLVRSIEYYQTEPEVVELVELAQDLFDLEVPNLEALLRLLTGSESPSASALLQGESDMAKAHRDGIEAMGEMLMFMGRTRLGVMAVCLARMARPSELSAIPTRESTSALSVVLHSCVRYPDAVVMGDQELAELQRMLVPDNSEPLASQLATLWHDQRPRRHGTAGAEDAPTCARAGPPGDAGRPAQP